MGQKAEIVELVRITFLYATNLLRASIYIVFANDFSQNEDFANINPISKSWLKRGILAF